jgi:fructose-specific phosphotransferase system IIC component
MIRHTCAIILGSLFFIFGSSFFLFIVRLSGDIGNSGFFAYVVGNFFAGVITHVVSDFIREKVSPNLSSRLYPIFTAVPTLLIFLTLGVKEGFEGWLPSAIGICIATASCSWNSK